MLGLIKKGAELIFSVEEHGIEELTRERLAICASCERFNSENNQCRQCGCFMDVKAKLTTNRNPLKDRIEITHCPLGKWNDKHIVNLYQKT